MRLTYSKVMSTAAVFLALGGTSYAAVAAIGSKEIRDGSLTGRDVKNHSLRALDFRKGDLPRGPQGEQGPTGPQGVAGLPGNDGEDGIGSVTYRTVGFSVPADQIAQKTVPCAQGESVVGGGFLPAGGNIVDTQVIANGPDVNGDGSGWAVQIRNLDVNDDNSTSLLPDVYAVCAKNPGD